MAVSYKKLYEEVCKREALLQAQLKRLRDQQGREVNRVHAFITANRGQHLAETPAIVDLAGIARHMRVARYTPQQWQQRDLLPPVDFPEIREPIWLVSTIIKQFAVPTGRPWYDTPEAEDGEALSAVA